MPRLITTNPQYALTVIDKLRAQWNQDKGPASWKKLIGQEENTDKKYIRVAGVSDMTGPFITAENDTFTGADHVMPFYADFEVKKYAFAYEVSAEAQFTDQTDKMGLPGLVKKPVDMMAYKMRYQENQSAADLLNLSFATFASSGAKAIETVAACSTTHATSAGAVGSNLMATALSVAAVQTAIQNVMSQVSYMGTPWQYSGGYILVVPPALYMLALEIAQSSDRPDTADRAKNVLQPFIKVVVDPHLTSTTDWWLLPDEKDANPLTRLHRMPWKVDTDVIKSTGGGLAIYVSQEFGDYWAGYQGTMGSNT